MDHQAISRAVREKIDAYKPQGNLDHTAKLFLNLAAQEHEPVKEHSERMALLAEAIAVRMKMDSKAAFFAALLHDFGKIVQDSGLFDGHDISLEEYFKVKMHAAAGHDILKDLHLFIALISGIHHALAKNGYGITLEDFPKEWGLHTIAKLFEIAMIVTICDFVDAATHRTTKPKDGSDKNTSDLRQMLYEKYPNHHLMIDIAIEENKW